MECKWGSGGKTSEAWRSEHLTFENFEIYYQNNAFLDIVSAKIPPKNLRNLFVPIILKCNILAIILFRY